MTHWCAMQVGIHAAGQLQNGPGPAIAGTSASSWSYALAASALIDEVLQRQLSVLQSSPLIAPTQSLEVSHDVSRLERSRSKHVPASLVVLTSAPASTAPPPSAQPAGWSGPKPQTAHCPPMQRGSPGNAQGQASSVSPDVADPNRSLPDMFTGVLPQEHSPEQIVPVRTVLQSPSDAHSRSLGPSSKSTQLPFVPLVPITVVSTTVLTEVPRLVPLPLPELVSVALPSPAPAVFPPHAAGPRATAARPIERTMR